MKGFQFKKKNGLPPLKCVLRLSYVVRWSIYGHFMDFRVTGFLCTFFFFTEKLAQLFFLKEVEPSPEHNDKTSSIW